MRLALTALAVGTLFVALPAFAQPQPPKSPNPSDDPAPLAGQKSEAVGREGPLAAKPDEAEPPPVRVPPPPPPLGLKQPESEAPPPVPSPFGGDDNDQEELAGFRGGFFIRDRRDYFRLFPEAWLGADVSSTFGPGVSRLPENKGGRDVTTKLELSHARLGLEGELLRRWNFMVSVDFGGQSIANADAATTSASGHPAEVQSTTPNVALADAWLEYHLCNCLSVMLGQFNAPIGIENRTADPFTPFRERNLAIRGLVAPGSKDLGAMAFGFFGERFFNYELGVFEGDGPNKPGVDSRVDFVGRVFVRPLAGRSFGDFGRTAQIGISTRLGERDPTRVGYDVPAITTGEGFTLWRPTYADHLGRIEHIIPSGAQSLVGGELRFEVSRVSFQSETYFVDNHTRESVDGFQLTNIERTGAMRGAGWYVQLSAWVLGDAFVRPEPGIIQPRQLDLHAIPGKPQRGLELLAIVSGIDASYEGASRKGTLDPAAPPSNVSLYQVGLAAQYWHTRHVRFAIDYDLYVAPGSGNTSSTMVPDNFVISSAGAVGASHVMHELGGRLAVAL